MGGIPSAFIMTRTPVLQVDAWAVAPNSARPAWNRASVTIEAIRDACYGAMAHQVIAMPAGFTAVELQGVIPRSEPRRMTGDVDAIAHYVITLEFSYSLAGLTSASTEG
jgi:hypothetical protein